eukprot:TRINITY_DN266_c0_g1_i3.p1 TRINITY_DN266_c0_g1~~TRINITY_DN266_c0_g1_i3.p1  ORF type:complete len:241 (+),score=45.30 TRINITY_DN266_c0_g1_i3:1255-1977(+)
MESNFVYLFGNWGCLLGFKLLVCVSASSLQRSGYEVYILETPQIPPADCFARNVHDFTLPQIEEMAKRWESTPPLYNLLNVSSLLHADELSSEGITEVEMDADDLDRDREEEEEEASPVEVSAKWSGEEDDSRYNSDDEETEDVPAQASTSTRWEPRAKPKKGIVKRGTGPAAAADNVDSEDDDDGNASTGVAFGNALFGLMAAYTKIQKQVRWADFEVRASLLFSNVECSAGSIKTAML